MVINITNLKKKIIYRSIYRGSKEMDKLLSSFTKKYINGFNEEELNYLSNLLEIDDENLYKLNQGKKLSIKTDTNKVVQLFKNFVFKSD